MLTARLHAIGAPLQIDTLPVPQPAPTDVLIEVKACNLVPNVKNVLTKVRPDKPLPDLPASFGLDAAGIVTEVGSEVIAIRPGDRVYAMAGMGCGSCRACRSGEAINCRSFTYRGYFGRGPIARRILQRYPYGGLSQFITAPQALLVKLPDKVGFEEASRFGYLGTAYSALRKAKVGPARSVLINATGGTLGLGTVLLALAMGASKILGTGRNQALLDRVKALCPDRIETLSVQDSPLSIRDWAFSLTDGEGVDAVIDALPPGTPSGATMAALRGLRVGGCAVLPGGMKEALTLDPYWLNDTHAQLIGSRWFSTAEGEDMAQMAAAGTLDLSVLEHRRFSLEQVNEAIASLGSGNGGFTNTVVIP